MNSIVQGPLLRGKAARRTSHEFRGRDFSKSRSLGARSGGISTSVAKRSATIRPTANQMAAESNSHFYFAICDAHAYYSLCVSSLTPRAVTPFNVISKLCHFREWAKLSAHMFAPHRFASIEMKHTPPRCFGGFGGYALRQMSGCRICRWRPLFLRWPPKCP
jgi:hypothetical protein